jgi:hypothetical protein
LTALKCAKPAKNLQKTASTLKKPKKTVEIRGFSIDFAGPEAALFYDGRVLRSRMNTGVSRVSALIPLAPCGKYFRGRSPSTPAARRGSPAKENKQWQQD